MEIGFTDIKIIESANPSFSPVTSTVNGSFVISFFAPASLSEVIVSEKSNIDCVSGRYAAKFSSSSN